MFIFIVRRIFVAWLTISGSFAFIYSLAATFGDPLAEIRLSNPENLEYLLLAATRELRLDLSIPERFFGWYQDIIKSAFAGDFSLGEGLNGREVTEGLFQAISPTLTLVLLATVVSLVLGSICGLIAASQLSTLRSSVLSLIFFLGYVSPTFWIGHLVKQYVVVELNDSASFLINWSTTLSLFTSSSFLVIIGSFLYLSKFSLEDRKLRRRFSAQIFMALVLLGFSGFVLEAISSAVGLLIFSALSIVIWSSVAWIGSEEKNRGLSLGWQFGLLWAFSAVLQKLISTFPSYMEREEISGRPFPSFAYESVWYSDPGFWIQELDRVLHVILPALAISVTTAALYFQVSKNAAQEASESDYVKLARAKGIPEIEISVRHVLRNAYLALVNTFVPNYLYLINGVIIIELVFGWQGLGVYLMSSLFTYDLNRLMGGIFIIGVGTFLMMLFSDLLLHRIDPRVREISSG